MYIIVKKMIQKIIVIVSLFSLLIITLTNAQNNTDIYYIEDVKNIRNDIFSKHIELETCLFNYNIQLREHEFEYSLRVSHVIHEFMNLQNPEISKIQEFDYEIQRLHNESNVISENIMNESTKICGEIECLFLCFIFLNFNCS
jgi:hypothetical protein